MSDTKLIEVASEDGTTRARLTGEDLMLLGKGDTVIHASDGVLAGLYVPRWGFCYIRRDEEGRPYVIAVDQYRGAGWVRQFEASESADWIAVKLATYPVPTTGNSFTIRIVRKGEIETDPPRLSEGLISLTAWSNQDQRFAVATHDDIWIWDSVSQRFNICVHFGQTIDDEGCGFTQGHINRIEWSPDDRWISRHACSTDTFPPEHFDMHDVAVIDSISCRQVVRLLLRDHKQQEWDGNRLKIWCAVCYREPMWATTRVITIDPETEDVSVDNLLRFVSPASSAACPVGEPSIDY